jgi:hypothetical protein
MYFRAAGQKGDTRHMPEFQRREPRDMLECPLFAGFLRLDLNAAVRTAGQYSRFFLIPGSGTG